MKLTYKRNGEINMSKHIIEQLIDEGVKTWNGDDYVPYSQNIIDFMKEYEELCKKHDISLGHEDMHGAFELYKYDEENIKWVVCGNSYV